MESRILGPLAVRDGDRQLALGGARQRALLGLLLVHANEVVSSDRLVDALWNEAGLAEGSKALQVAVSRLRKVIGPDVLLTRTPGYELRFEPSLQTELSRLEEMRLAALEDRIEAELALGRHAEAIGELAGLTGRYPLR